MEISKDKKIYFSSDNHLGSPSTEESQEREKIFVSWLESIKHDADIIFLLGDLFDFCLNIKKLFQEDLLEFWESLQNYQIQE